MNLSGSDWTLEAFITHVSLLLSWGNISERVSRLLEFMV